MTVAELDFLDEADVLDYGELAVAGERGLGETGEDRPVGAVRCGRPLIYPVPVACLPAMIQRRAEATGCTYVGALFAFDLELLSGGRCRAARFEVSLADSRALAVRLNEDGDDLGITFEGDPITSTAAVTVDAAGRRRPGWLARLVGRTHLDRPLTVGAQSPRFAWLYADPRGDLPRSYGMHALVEIPAGASELQGAIDVQVELGGRGHVAALRRSTTFAEPLTPAAPPVGGAAVRLCMASDVAGYSRRSNAETKRIQSDLVDVLSRARQAAGIADAKVRPQAQGDGQFTVLPVGVDESVVIPRLVAAVGRELRRRNAGMGEDGRMRVRLALHRGLIKEGRNGWIGAAPIAVHRIVDCDPLREALTGHPGADFVLGLPDALYRDVIVPAEEPPGPDDFTAMPVELPKKGFVEHCWLHIGREYAR
jgi:hypothetical protein